jgi:hypothetical protein
VCISAVIKELRTAAIVAVKLAVSVVSSRFVSFSQISRYRLGCICLFVGVN